MQLSCAECGTTFEAQRATRRFCGQACQKRASRNTPTPLRQVKIERAAVVAPADPDDDGSLAWATMHDLRAAGRIDTTYGRLAIKAARIIDASTAVMGMAALMKEYEQRLEKALAGVQQEADPLDEVNERRAKKTGGA